jgi:hypothetical protein
MTDQVKNMLEDTTPQHVFGRFDDEP